MHIRVAVQVLLDAGADIHAHNKTGGTALIHAAHASNPSKPPHEPMVRSYAPVLTLNQIGNSSCHHYMRYACPFLHALAPASAVQPHESMCSCLKCVAGQLQVCFISAFNLLHHYRYTNSSA